MDDSKRAQIPYTPATGGSSSSTDDATITHNEHPLHAEHGVLIDKVTTGKMRSDVEYEYNQDLLWTRIRHFMRDPFMEFSQSPSPSVYGWRYPNISSGHDDYDYLWRWLVSRLSIQAGPPMITELFL